MSQYLIWRRVFLLIQFMQSCKRSVTCAQVIQKIARRHDSMIKRPLGSRVGMQLADGAWPDAYAMPNVYINSVPMRWVTETYIQEKDYFVRSGPKVFFVSDENIPTCVAPYTTLRMDDMYYNIIKVTRGTRS